MPLRKILIKCRNQIKWNHVNSGLHRRPKGNTAVETVIFLIVKHALVLYPIMHWISTFVCRYHSYPRKSLHFLLHRWIQLVEAILMILSAFRTDNGLMSYSAQNITFC